jgi:nucleoside-diphosphate-sugar epimerase
LNILLTGATGFVGSYILAQLIKCGHNVTIIKRFNSDTKRIDDFLNIISVIEDHKKMTSSEVFDCIIHAATSYEKNNYAGSEILPANINLPVYLLDYAVNNKCKKFINISTFIAKYKSSAPNKYALTKRHIEEWGIYYSSKHSLNFVNVVLHQVYGIGDSINKFIPWLVNELKTNVKSIDLTEGMQERDFINVIDVAVAISLIVDQKTDNCYEEYEVCTGNVITIKKFVEIVKNVTNSSTTLNFGSKNYRQNEIMKLKPNPTKLLSLGWSPSLKLENGIEKMLKRNI